MSSKTISVVNQKGGVGKTTTVVNLGASLALLGKNTLLIDIDPQAHTTIGLGIEKEIIKISIYELLFEEDLKIEDAILGSRIIGLDIIPSTIELAGAEVELVEIENREIRLKKIVEKIKDKYEFILIDCPPSLGILTINALSCCDSVIIPIQCEFYALEGLSQLLNTLELVRKSLNPSLKIEGILLTMFDARTILSQQVKEEIKRHFEKKVYKSLIPRSVRVAESPSYGMPLVLYDPNSKAAEAYLSLAKEVIER
jgi:chromosome partitioning protein